MLDRMLRATTAPAWFFLVLFAAYAATAHYGGEVVNDVHSAAHASWSLATRGTLDLSGTDLPYEQAWTAQVGVGLYSNRFPGVILGALPLYALTRPELPAVAPSALSAALASAMGVTFMLVGMRRLCPLRWAWASAAALGLGTAVWSVAADGQWGHGFTTLWLGLVWLCLVLGGRWRALLVVATAMAVLTRPHLAVASAALAVVMWRTDRRSAISLVAGTAVGAAAFLVYGRVVFGAWSVLGPYKIYDQDYGITLGEQPPERTSTLVWVLDNVGVALVAPRFGLLTTLPVIVAVVWAAARLRRWPPRPTVALLAGALGYAATALVLTRASGGSGFWGNRTLIESVVLAWPVATWVLVQHRGGRAWRVVVAVSVAWAVLFHGLGALVPSPAPSGEGGSALFWPVPAGLSLLPPWQLLVVAALTTVAALTAWRLTARPAPQVDPGTGDDSRVSAVTTATTRSD